MSASDSGFGVDAANVGWRAVCGQQLDCADAIATDLFQQLERAGRIGAEFRRQALANSRAVREQVVEPGFDDAPGKWGRSLGERQRKR